jgi:hypothetical protein
MPLELMTGAKLTLQHLPFASDPLLSQMIGLLFRGHNLVPQVVCIPAEGLCIMEGIHGASYPLNSSKFSGIWMPNPSITAMHLHTSGRNHKQAPILIEQVFAFRQPQSLVEVDLPFVIDDAM